MAEFCLDCWNRMNETNDPPKKYVISKELELCEGCGEWKPVIVKMRGGLSLRERIYVKLWLWNHKHEVKKYKRKRGF